ncbi:GNAT family N-acetyltransferase [Novosphingobium mangrovi (ex Huang et al. 2023)]|uniref:GNAT family N-acetyltransferase n=1 Tax=Novosphingobium mangrovi (ex Huang et al. 2023) TaxID=2976432 RepID=A0ABT2I2Q8_9SPHN|nr:GNAT family N-acetyltransferase [Novosphingobium mangrovi (ex Huang et al. 2023)]MCT2398938.1 GNAT family N-acetyltransferase [Novosphingobium mangrovi (ex Huang et al. 2023)]
MGMPGGQPAGCASWRRAQGLPCDSRMRLGWRRLEASGSLPSQTFAFHAALAETMMADRVLDVVAVLEKDEPVAILPLCRRRGWFRRWHGAGARQVYEPVDALCRDAGAVARLAGKLARLSRPLRLDRVPAHSPLIPALAAAMKGRGLIVTRPAQASPTIAFEEGETDPAQRFNAGRRSDFRRARRRAEALGEVSFEMHVPSPETFDGLFEQAVAVEQRSWKGEVGTALGTDAVKAAFFHDFLLGACEDGNCRIAFMRIDGKAVAMHLAVEFQQRYWLFKIGFDQAFSRCSPGNLLMLHALADVMARGLRGVELLGEVEPWIAEVWTREATPCLRVQTYPFNVRGLASLAAEVTIWAWHRLPLRRGAK